MDEELSNLIKKLRDESSFVHSEKKFLIDLYRQLVKKSEQLFNKQWLIGKQHLLLDDLIFGRNKFTINQCCTKFSSLESKIQFIESYKILGHNDYYVAEFLKSLREKPKYLASLIVKSEKQQHPSNTNNSNNANANANTGPTQGFNGMVESGHQLFSSQQLISILFQSLYGNCVLVQDEYYCLQLLNHLIEIQFSQNEAGQNDGPDLRRLIRKQSCSFNILFKLYTSFSHSAQLFLTASLYDPITQILTDEWFLDIDPDKALARFGSDEISNKFGHPSSREYKLKTQKYREKIVNSLYTITMSFIDSISSNLFCFPSSLIWLVNQFYQIVSKNVSSKSNPSPSNQQDIAKKLCCDIIMALYICPAICDPEPYGVITDVQISAVARHNLMQIANILQVLAMSEDDKDVKAQDLYSKFRNNCVSDILNNIISVPKSKSHQQGGSTLNDAQSLQLELAHTATATAAATASAAANANNILLNEMSSSNLSNSSSITNNSNFILSRTTIMISVQDLNRLLIYLRKFVKEQPQQTQNQLVSICTSTEIDETKWLKSIMPLDYLKVTLENVANQLNSKQNISVSNSNTRSSNVPAMPVYTSESTEVVLALLKESHFDQTDTQQVLVININDKGIECPGMLSEEKVINECESNSVASAIYLKNKEKLETASGGAKKHRDHRDQCKPGSHKRGKYLNALNSKSALEPKNKINSVGDDPDDFLDTSFEPGVADSRIKAPSEIGLDDVRSRHDGSVEGISEVNECASISSNDDEDEPNPDQINDDDVDQDDDDVNQLADGLSDFDNFSGRDTPIISGRDTPSSHSHEDLQNTSSTRISNNINSLNQSSSTQNAIMINANNTNGGSGVVNSISTIIPRGPQLPVTVRKANREDINDKFCKFEINKINPVKEEQLSETGWSLDADPPESMNNDTINDRLGLDENSLISVSSSSANTVSTYSTNSRYNQKASFNSNLSQNSISTNIINSSNNVISANSQANNANISATIQPPNQLINIEQDFLTTNPNSTPTSTIATPTAPTPVNLPSSYMNTTISTANTSLPTVNSLANLISSANPNVTTESSADLNNLDDRFSVVSDSAAWSTDLIANSDSDLESNSPSKYTPYSTYSSTYSNVNTSALNQSLINEIALNSQNQQQQQQQQSFTSSISSNSLANNNNNNSNSNSNMILSHANSANNFAANNAPDLNSQKLNNTPEPNNTNSTASGSNGKNKLSSIFTSNSNSVKFSLTSTLNNLGNNNVPQKKSGLQRIFPFNKSSSSNSSKQQQINDPFASLNPFGNTSPNNVTNTTSVSNSAESQLDNGIDNILKKYSNKSNSSSQLVTPNTQTNQPSLDAQLIDISIPTCASENTNSSLPKNTSSNSLPTVQSDQILYDPNNLENSKAFLDAKKKLRIVLSWSDNCTYNFMPIMHFKSNKDNFLTMYLKTQLFDAISLQDKEKEAQLYETMRCVSIFSEQECYKLMRSLKKDYTRRVFYMTYLTKSKQNVLYSLNLVDKLLRRSDWHQKLCTHRLATVVTRIFLETKENENQMYKFINDFRTLVAVDEKFDLFKKYIQQLKKDYDPIWNGCQEDVVKLGYLCLERLVLSKVYSYVMYPNGEIDHYRDTKVSECFNELANTITPAHPLIGISPIYQNECPWISAQMELRKLNIYKTPQDKLACIRKCLLTIQNLLAIAKSPVCADDLHPVLIYVIIKANPPTFLSNVQYIEGFYGSQLESEDYYWAQFIFAFSYIKANMLGNKVVSTSSN